jgi:hypothetical protein
LIASAALVADIFLVIPMLLIFGALMYFVGYSNGEMDGILDADKGHERREELRRAHSTTPRRDP